jgi:hypothetical protein
MKTEQEIADLFARLTTEREEAIERLLAADDVERWMAAMRYDMTEAPMSSNREMLHMIGVSTDISGPDDVKRITDGLAVWGIIVEGEYQYSDKLAKVIGIALDERVRMVPPNKDGREYIEWNTLMEEPCAAI